MLDAEVMQERWSKTRDRAVRRQSGQFFTPRWIARGMARWVLDAHPTCIVDPAFGFGILVDECSRQGFEGRAMGYEIDPDLAAAWREGTDGQSRVELINQDFLGAEPTPIEAAIANPPYNRFQNHDLSHHVRLHLQDVLGETASGFTNQYALFIYLVVSRLTAQGRAAFIVPSEFLATGYGVQVKNFLLRTCRLQHLVLFDTSERVFADAATTACVLLFGCAEQTELNVWHLAGLSDDARFMALCSGELRVKPDATVAYSTLNPAANWQGLGLGSDDFAGLVPLADFGQTKRGIATGANEFFVLSHSEAVQRKLSEINLLPCIPSADSAMRPIFDVADWQALRDGGRPAYLFDGAVTSTTAPCISAARYIEHGERQGYHLRYLTRTRRPWYRLEQRTVPQLLLAVFGRGGFRAVLNRSQAVNLTSFHAFYARPEYKHMVGILWLYLQTPLAHGAFERQQRAYGDGLKKLEPGDWNKLLVPDWRQWPIQALRRAEYLAEMAQEADRMGTAGQWSNAVNEFVALIQKYRAMHEQTQCATVLTQQLTLV